MSSFILLQIAVEISQGLVLGISLASLNSWLSVGWIRSSAHNRWKGVKDRGILIATRVIMKSRERQLNKQPKWMAANSVGSR